MEAISLDYTGKIYNKNHKSIKQVGGLFTILKNHLIRGNYWKFLTCHFHQQTSEMCVIDERGQVYLLNFKHNTYHSLKLASSTIYSIDFIHSRPSNVIIGYRSGLTIVLDTITQKIVSTLFIRGNESICKICCHPLKPLAILLSSSGTLTLWNLRFVLLLVVAVVVDDVLLFLLGHSLIDWLTVLVS